MKNNASQRFACPFATFPCPRGFTNTNFGPFLDQRECSNRSAPPTERGEPSPSAEIVFVAAQKTRLRRLRHPLPAQRPWPRTGRRGAFDPQPQTQEDTSKALWRCFQLVESIRAHIQTLKCPQRCLLWFQSRLAKEAPMRSSPLPRVLVPTPRPLPLHSMMMPSLQRKQFPRWKLRPSPPLRRLPAWLSIRRLHPHHL
jgi:hypothetical protein